MKKVRHPTGWPGCMALTSDLSEVIVEKMGSAGGPVAIVTPGPDSTDSLSMESLFAGTSPGVRPLYYRTHAENVGPSGILNPPLSASK